jgi:NADH-ubiquinone oxidoreductase chain 1
MLKGNIVSEGLFFLAIFWAFFHSALSPTAQLISYELILSSAILLVVLLTGSLNFTLNIETQKTVFFILPL